MGEQVSIVIPIWKAELDNFELISLKQCLTVLSGHNFSIITHSDLNIKPILSVFDRYAVTYTVYNFNKRYFLNIDGYNRLMLSPFFYLKFIRFTYILIYQLDCFVFKDELNFWIKKGYSYIGAPWVKNHDQGDLDATVTGVGNGGFSLRNVRDHLNTLLSFNYLFSPQKVFTQIYRNSETKTIARLLLLLSKMTVTNNTFFLFNDFHKWNMWEDYFWSKYASKSEWFSLPSWEVAATFSVEVQPSRFIRTENDLPFGCHAWWKHDFKFWKPYIEAFSHKLDSGKSFEP